MSNGAEAKSNASVVNGSNPNLSEDSTRLQLRDRQSEQRALTHTDPSRHRAKESRDQLLSRVDENEINHLRQTQQRQSSIPKAEVASINQTEKLLEINFQYLSQQATPQELEQHKILLQKKLDEVVPLLARTPEGEKLKVSLTQFLERLRIAENFRNGVNKNITSLSEEIESVDHWYSFRRGQVPLLREYIQNEQNLLASQLKREKELREELAKAIKDAEWVAKLIAVGRDSEAETQGTEIEQALKKNNSFIDVNVAKETIAQNQKISAQALKNLPSANPVVNLARAVGAVRELIVDPLWNLGIQAIFGCVRAAIWIQEKATKVWEMACEYGRGGKRGFWRLWDLLKDPKTWESVGEALSAITTIAVNGIGAACDKLTTWSTYVDAWNAVTTKDFWSNLGSSIWNPICNLFEAARGSISESGLWKSITNGLSKAWSAIQTKEFWSSVGMGILKGLAAAGQFCLDVVTDPAKAWATAVTVAKFGWQVLNDLGVVDLVVGLAKLAAAPFAFVLGHTAAILRLGLDFAGVVLGLTTADQMKQNYRSMTGWANETGLNLVKGGWTALKGAATLIGQVSGLMDLGLMVMFALQGNFAMAGICAFGVILSWGSIGATIATAGAAGGTIIAAMAMRSSFKTAMQKALKVAAVEFLEAGAKEIGEAVVNDLAKNLTTQTIETVGKKIAHEGSEQIAKFVSKHGVKELTGELVTDVMKETASETVEKMLSEAGLQKLVKDNVLQFFEQCAGKSKKELQILLGEMGVKSKSAAKHLSSELRAAVKKGKIPTRITDALEEGITKEVTAVIEAGMEKQFKSEFRKILTGELGDETSKTLSKAIKIKAKELGKEASELVDEFVESGWKGVREGIEQATRKIVKAGIADALRAFKEAHSRIPLPLPNAREENFRKFEAARAAVLASATVAGGEFKDAVQAERKEEAMVNEIENAPQETRVEIIQIGDQTIEYLYVRNSEGEWELSSAEPIARAVEVIAKRREEMEEVAAK